MWKRAGTSTPAVLIVMIALLHGPVRAQPAPGSYKQLEGVERLFDVIAAIVERNPAYAETLERVAVMDDAAAAQAFDSLAEANRRNPAISGKIDSLLASETYRIYFRRFRNVNPEIFRTAFVHLPYRAVPSPGGIASCFLELCGSVEEIREWMRDVVRRIEIPRCATIAERWLPEGDYAPVTIYFIYDSNAGSFTAQGKPFLNLQSMIGEISPGGDLPDQLASIDITAIEQVIAHELQHIYARPVLYPRNRVFAAWQDRWLDKIVREIVSEGVAGQCNPCAGMKKELWEDPDVIAALIRGLNETCLAMYDGTLGEREMSAWYGASFQDAARDLLKAHLLKQYDQQAAVRLLGRYMPVRPDLVHTLGWWMVSRITDRQSNRNPALSLLTDPSSLFERYNATLPPDAGALRVDDRVVARLRALGDSARQQERN